MVDQVLFYSNKNGKSCDRLLRDDCNIYAPHKTARVCYILTVCTTRCTSSDLYSSHGALTAAVAIFTSIYIQPLAFFLLHRAYTPHSALIINILHTHLEL